MLDSLKLIKQICRMLSMLSHLYKALFEKSEYNVLILGLQNTGKTRLFNIIKNYDSLKGKLSPNATYTATVGFNTINFKSSELSLNVWDLGGKKGLRQIWENYYPEAHGLIFMFDERVEEGLQILKSVLGHNQMGKIPCLLLVPAKEQKAEVERLIKSNSGVFERVYEVEEFTFEQIGLLGNAQISVKRQQLRIKELLKWIYDEITRVDAEVKSYS